MPRPFTHPCVLSGVRGLDHAPYMKLWRLSGAGQRGVELHKVLPKITAIHLMCDVEAVDPLLALDAVAPHGYHGNSIVVTLTPRPSNSVGAGGGGGFRGHQHIVCTAVGGATALQGVDGPIPSPCPSPLQVHGQGGAVVPSLEGLGATTTGAAVEGGWNGVVQKLNVVFAEAEPQQPTGDNKCDNLYRNTSH